MKQITLFFLITLLLSCNDSNNCEEYYNNYISLRFESKDEKATTLINKAINCDKKNEDFRFEKVKFLIDLNKYAEAKQALTDLGKINRSFKSELPLNGLLDLKIGGNKGNDELRKVFDNLSKVKYDKNNFNLFYYKLLTQLYIKGKESTLNEIKRQNIYSSLNEKAGIEHLSKLINSEKDSLNILYEIFKIK
jgi:hypothetical protein